MYGQCLGAGDGRIGTLGAQVVELELEGANFVGKTNSRAQGIVGNLDTKMFFETGFEICQFACKMCDLQIVTLALGEANQVGIWRL